LFMFCSNRLNEGRQAAREWGSPGRMNPTPRYA
jgi:hypothetical protein